MARITLPATPLVFQGDFFQRSGTRTLAFQSRTLVSGRPAGVTKEPAYKGKYVLVDLWATWCGPCLTAMPKIEAHWKALKHNANLAFVGVCVSDERAAFDKWVKENGPGYSFTIGYDPAGKQKLGKDVMCLYGVAAIPTTYVLDPEGKILAVYTGLTPENEKALLTLLEEKGIKER